jgi:hypothetical protein
MFAASGNAQAIVYLGARRIGPSNFMKRLHGRPARLAISGMELIKIGNYMEEVSLILESVVGEPRAVERLSITNKRRPTLGYGQDLLERVSTRSRTSPDMEYRRFVNFKRLTCRG